MFLVRSLFILFSFSFCKCYRIRDYEGLTKNKYDNFIQSYVNPIKQLSASFPGHEVELQVEFQGSITQPPRAANGRRRIYIYKPPKYLRAGAGDSESTNSASVTTNKAPITTITTTTTTLSPSTASTANMIELADLRHQNQSNYSGKELVYKEDLDEAIKSLEKKVCKNGNCNDKEFLKPQVKILSHTYTHGTNIDRIIQMLQKGSVKLQRYAPKPQDDSSLEWLQIKIPKTEYP